MKCPQRTDFRSSSGGGDTLVQARVLPTLHKEDSLSEGSPKNQTEVYCYMWKLTWPPIVREIA